MIASARAIPRSRTALTAFIAALLILGAAGMVALSPAKAHAAAKPKLSATSKKVVKGQSFTLKVKNASGKKISWKSSNKRVATVSKKGKVTTKKAGSATITATVAGKKLTCKVKVYGSAKQKALASLDGWWHTGRAFGEYVCIKNGHLYRFPAKFDNDYNFIGYKTSGVIKEKFSLSRIKRSPLGDGAAYLVKINGKTRYCYNDDDLHSLQCWDGANYSGGSGLFRVDTSEVPSNLKKYMKKR